MRLGLFKHYYKLLHLFCCTFRIPTLVSLKSLTTNKFNLSECVIYEVNFLYRRLRARRALMLVNNVLLRTRRALLLFNSVFAENQKGTIAIEYIQQSAILVLSGTSLNSINILLGLNYQNVNSCPPDKSLKMCGYSCCRFPYKYSLSCMYVNSSKQFGNSGLIYHISLNFLFLALKLVS